MHIKRNMTYLKKYDIYILKKYDIYILKEIWHIQIKGNIKCTN